MTRKLESLFDLPSSDPEDTAVTPEPQPTFPVLPETLDALDKIEAALPAVRGLEAIRKWTSWPPRPLKSLTISWIWACR